MAYEAISTNLTAGGGGRTITAATLGTIADGDILVAYAISDSTSDTVTWPSGFVAVTNSPITTSTTDGGRLHVATKKASGESGNYTITGSASIICGILRFSGRDGTGYLHRVKDTSQNTSTASPWTFTAAAFSSNTSATCDIVFIASSDKNSASSPVVYSTPSGFTTRVSMNSGFFAGVVHTKDAQASGYNGVESWTGTLAGDSADRAIFGIALMEPSGGGGASSWGAQLSDQLNRIVVPS